MYITLIGSGNTATVLGRLISSAGHIICGVYSKTVEHAQQLAVELNAQQCGDIESIAQNAELYIVAVNDDAIATIAGAVKLPGKTVVHTSGSVSINALSGMAGNTGVLYPLQSLRREAARQPVIPLLVDGSNAETKHQVRLLAQSLSPIVEDADDGRRLKLHLAAVMVSNFTNHLYALAEDFCIKEGVPFKALVPLINEVAERTAAYSAAGMQTGPAARGDSQTIEKHLRLLQGYPLQYAAYKHLTESILKFYGKTI